MDKKLKAKWIKALTSGRYKQTQETLREVSDLPRGRPAYCCLGVLLAVSKKGRWDEEDTYEIGSGEDAICLSGDLGRSGKDLFGVPDEVEKRLIHMNDKEGADFKEIAKVIRKEL